MPPIGRAAQVVTTTGSRRRVQSQFCPRRRPAWRASLPPTVLPLQPAATVRRVLSDNGLTLQSQSAAPGALGGHSNGLSRSRAITEVVSASACPRAIIIRCNSVASAVIGIGVVVARARSSTIFRSFMMVLR